MSRPGNELERLTNEIDRFKLAVLRMEKTNENLDNRIGATEVKLNSRRGVFSKANAAGKAQPSKRKAYAIAAREAKNLRKSTAKAKREVVMLERQFAVKLKRFNTAMKSNEAKKRVINEMRKDKVSFRAVFSGIQGKTRAVQKQISLQTELLQELHTITGNAHKRMDILSKQLADEREKHGTRFQSAQARVEKANEVIEDSRGTDGDEESGNDKARKPIGPVQGHHGAQWTATASDAANAKTKKKTRGIGVKWARLQAETGIETVDELIAFLEDDHDERNQRLQEASQLQADIEEVEADVKSIQQELEDETRHKKDPMVKSAQLEQIQGDVDGLEEQATRAEAYSKYLHDMLFHLSLPLQDLVEKVGRKDQKEALLGEHQPSLLDLIVQCMGVVEERANDVLCAAEIGSEEKTFTPGPKTPSGRMRLEHDNVRQRMAQVDPLVDFDAAGIDLEGDRPLDNDELIASVRDIVHNHATAAAETESDGDEAARDDVDQLRRARQRQKRAVTRDPRRKLNM